LTVESLKEKYALQKKSLANYSFFMGVNGDNIDEIIKTDTSQFIGFLMTACTLQGNLLADNPETMEKLFANCKSIIAIHSEKRRNNRSKRTGF
jgi:dihydroorotase